MPIEEGGGKQWFSLVIYGFCINNITYSKSLSFTKFIFLLTPFDIRDCYYFKLKEGLKPFNLRIFRFFPMHIDFK